MALRMRWRVGNGSSILIYNSRWLPKSWDFKVISPRLLPIDTQVSAILLEDGRWDDELVLGSFLEYEA